MYIQQRNAFHKRKILVLSIKYFHILTPSDFITLRTLTQVVSQYYKKMS